MSKSAQQIRFCTSRDGTRIAYATSGAGPPLVWSASFVHHLEEDWESPVWRPWLSALSRRHTLVRYDWRGCGLSDREGVEFSLQRFTEDLEAVTEATRLDPFALFGSAAGAAVSLTYAARHPEHVSHLVLYAGYVRNRLAGTPTIQQVEELDARLKVTELGWPDDIPAYGQFFTALRMPDASAEQARALAGLIRRTTSPANAVALIRTFRGLDVTTAVQRIACPTLVLHARGDSVIPFELGRALAGIIPGARFVPLESRNHVLVQTEPAWDRFVAALDDFLPPSPDALGSSSTLSLGELTRRECEVLELVARGLDNGTIASRLGISERTARNHVSAILGKLSLGTRAQAIVRAREAGFGRTARGLR